MLLLLSLMLLLLMLGLLKKEFWRNSAKQF